MKKQDTVNKIKNNDEFSSGLMESYGKWMSGDCFQNTTLPDIHEAPFDGMDPQSNGAEIEDITKKKKEVKKVTPVGAKETAPANEEYEVLEREEIELEGELYVIEKRRYFATEGSMKQARANVGASTCWKGYKAKGTKMKGGKSVPNCVKEDEFHHQKDKDGNTIPHEDEIAQENYRAMRNPESQKDPDESDKPYRERSRANRMKDPKRGINSPAFKEFMRKQGYGESYNPKAALTESTWLMYEKKKIS